MVGIVGLLVGLLIMYLFSDRETKKGRDDGIPADLRKDGFSDVARLLYSPSKKRIITGMDGGFFREAKELTPDQRTRLSKVIRIWTEWTNRPIEETVEPAPAAAAPETPAAEETPIASQAAAAQVETQPFDAASVFTPAQEPVVSTESEGATRPVVDLVNEETAAIPDEISEPAEEPAPPVVKNQTIVEQINDVLQEKLAGTPYEQRGLILQDNLNNGVIVYVGGEKYEGIELVPYPDAQELIRSSVAEWEKKFESN